MILACNRCHISLDINEFYIDKTYTSGRKPTCKKCYNEESAERYHQNNGKERGLERYYEYMKNPEYVERRRAQQRKIDSHTIGGRIKAWRASAKRRGIVWQIDQEYLLTLPMVCYYTGESLVVSPNQFNTISLDRIDSSKGYIRGNVVFCCTDVNLMKRHFPASHFFDLCERISNLKKTREMSND